MRETIKYSGLSSLFNRHLFKKDTSAKRAPRVGLCLFLLILFDSIRRAFLYFSKVSVF